MITFKDMVKKQNFFFNYRYLNNNLPSYFLIITRPIDFSVVIYDEKSILAQSGHFGNAHGTHHLYLYRSQNARPVSVCLRESGGWAFWAHRVTEKVICAHTKTWMPDQITWLYYLAQTVSRCYPTPTEIDDLWISSAHFSFLAIKNLHIWGKYCSEDAYMKGKSVRCDLKSNWASLLSLEARLLYPIQHRIRPVSAKFCPVGYTVMTESNNIHKWSTHEV